MAKSNIEKLMELKQLYEQGILTKEEMEAEKTKILNAPTPKVESPNNENPPVEDAESSFASTSDEGNHGRNNKVIFGIAAVIVVAIVAIIGFFLNKQTEPKEAVTDDIELAQLADEVKQDSQKETENFYNQLLSLNELFSVKDDETSDRLVVLLKKYNYVHKESEDDGNSGDWEKNIIVDGVSSKVKVHWEIGRYEIFYLDMECIEDTIAKRWLSEIERLGYKMKKTSSDKSQDTWVGEKSENDWVAINHDKKEKKYSLSTRVGFSVAYGTYEEAEKKAAQRVQNEIKELRSQAISIGQVIDAYNNNVGGRADNLYYKQEKLYKCRFKNIKESSGNYNYVLEGFVFGNKSNESGEIRLYTDQSDLTNINYPVTIVFRGSLVSINKSEYGHQLYYHFICSEALAYFYN